MKRYVAGTGLLLSCFSFASLAEAQPACGAVLTADTTLASDMFCPGSTALVIGADGITVDLNGYTISGDGVTPDAAGVRNIGYGNVTIENGTITGFDRGIHLSGASANTIRAITVDKNFFFGMLLHNNSTNNEIIDCVVINNGTPSRPGNGITINGSDGNLVTRTYAANNYTQGIFVGGGGNPSAPASSNTRILNNTSEHNVSNGIGIIGGSGHTIQGNISVNNGAHGVSLSSVPLTGPVTNSVIIANGLSGNTLNGIAMINSDDNRIIANRVNGNALHGISVRSGSDRNVIRGNEFDSNLRGIVVSLGGGFDAPKNNLFTGNHSTGNAVIDVVDETTGDGTAGTDSTYRGTRCDTSHPTGICVP